MASTYVEIVRGIPLLVQLFYIYYAIGQFVKVPDMVAAVVAMSFCYGAYMGEVFRAGILSISHGQTEAARSLGFSRTQTMFYVILPPGLADHIAAGGNEFIALLKDTPPWSPSWPSRTFCAGAGSSPRKASCISRPTPWWP